MVSGTRMFRKAFMTERAAAKGMDAAFRRRVRRQLSEDLFGRYVDPVAARALRRRPAEAARFVLGTSPPRFVAIPGKRRGPQNRRSAVCRADRPNPLERWKKALGPARSGKGILHGMPGNRTFAEPDGDFPEMQAVLSLHAEVACAPLRAVQVRFPDGRSLRTPRGPLPGTSGKRRVGLLPVSRKTT